MAATTPRRHLDVPPELMRGRHRDHDEWTASARFALDLLSRTAGRDDLAHVALLDIGCGTKLTKFLIDEDLPIGAYVGLDVSPEIVDWLVRTVDDERFEYHHLPARNDRYHPHGPTLAELEALPVGDQRFDLIALFSVFTHLDPADYVAMLRLARPHIAPDGHLLFSLFLDRDSRQNPLALALQALVDSPDPAVSAAARASINRTLESGVDPRYTDAVPDQPLLEARYTIDYALELIEGTGWVVESVNEPVPPHIQHYIVCTPA